MPPALFNIWIIFIQACLLLPAAYALDTEELDAAREVIIRTVPELKHSSGTLKLEPIPRQNGCDVFETESSGGTLTIRGSSGVALCRGFYDYLKTNNLGMVSWENKSIRWPERLPDTARRKVVSPVRHHYYLNAVTYGYTAPYWTWDRWEREIDWMALHGINLPLALAATEAIGTRVWRQLGLTRQEIDAFHVGPAHLPWQRMGNIVNHDGALSDAWHEDQVALQHNILHRMKSLGMQPVCPAFAGFVPAGLKRIYPDAKLLKLGWGGWPEKNAAHLLSPSDPLFRAIGSMYMKEWQKEFGKNTYHLADSFNEMELPVSAENAAAGNEMLGNLGEQVYRSISSVNPDAVWVMQGWMFGYQRNIWNADSLQALLRKVPDDKVLLLDLAADYNRHFWRNGMNWEVFKGFFNKPWVYSVVPNMGGKSAMTGPLEFYANGHLEALNSPLRGRLAGLGMAPEGVENNDVLYELITDAGWKGTRTDLTEWLDHYCTARYGACPPSMKQAWDLFRRTAYSELRDHPRFNWQLRPGARNCTMNTSEDFLKGLSLFVHTPGLEQSPFFRQDAIEMSVHYLGIRMFQASRAALEALDEQDYPRATQSMAYFRKLALSADALLEAHPAWRLERWIAFARRHGSTEAEKDRYEENARRLVTVWGPPVDDYSARLWSGLIRDYYLPRWEHFINCRMQRKAPDMAAWEKGWVRSRGVSPATAPQDIVQACREAVRQAGPLPPALAASRPGTVIGNWTPEDVSPAWKELFWPVSAEDLRRLHGVRFIYTSGRHALDISRVEIMGDGKVLATDAHAGRAGLPSSRVVYHLSVPDGSRANNGCVIRARVKSADGPDSHGKVELLLQN